MMEQMVNKAKADSNQELVEKNLTVLRHSADMLKEYITLVEEERLNMLASPGTSCSVLTPL